MSRVIAVTNQKGGVGKTTTALNLGAALAAAGKPTLLLDMDPQASLTAAVGLDPYEERPDAWAVLSDQGEPLHASAVRVDTRLYLLPGSVRAPGGPLDPGDLTPPPPERLRRVLRRYRLPFDFVLIDTPPSLGPLTTNALVAADEVLVPVQCQYLAMRGVRALFERVQRIRSERHPHLGFLGVVATMYRPESRIDREVVEELRRVLGDSRVRAVVEHDLRAAEAPIAGRALVSLHPESPAALAYRHLAENLTEP